MVDAPVGFAVEVCALFRGAPIGGRLLWPEDRGRGRRRGRRRAPDFVIGAAAGADAPADASFLEGAAHRLVTRAPSGYLVHLTPSMGGEVELDGQRVPLALVVARRGPSFPLAPGESLRIDCGELSFRVRVTDPPPPALAAPLGRWSRREGVYLGLLPLLGTLLVGIIVAGPFDLRTPADRTADGRLLAPVAAAIPGRSLIPARRPRAGIDDETNLAGGRHVGAEGVMGRTRAPRSESVRGVRGPPETPAPRLARDVDRTPRRRAGVLGRQRPTTPPSPTPALRPLAGEEPQAMGALDILARHKGSQIASVFGEERALGKDADDVLGGLLGTSLSEAYGVGGLGAVGTGAGGSGKGEGLVGLASNGTTFGAGAGYGHWRPGAGFRPRFPGVVMGYPIVHGTLSPQAHREVLARLYRVIPICWPYTRVLAWKYSGVVTLELIVDPSGRVVGMTMKEEVVPAKVAHRCFGFPTGLSRVPDPFYVTMTIRFRFDPRDGGRRLRRVGV
jgi:hypothetical protein